MIGIGASLSIILLVFENTFDDTLTFMSTRVSDICIFRGVNQCYTYIVPDHLTDDIHIETMSLFLWVAHHVKVSLLRLMIRILLNV